MIPPSRPFFVIFPSIALPMFLALLDQTMITTALPTIAADLGSVDSYSWVMIAYLLTMTIAAPVYGRLGDVFGKRRMLVIALLILMAASVLCALAETMAWLIAARAIQGAGSGGLLATAYALLAENVPPRERANYQGYVSTVGMSAAGFGPVAGGFLTEHLGWHSVFFVNFAVGAVGLALAFRLPAKPGSSGPFRFDYAGLFLFGIAVGALLLALEWGKHPQLDILPAVSGLTLLALAAGFLLIRHEGRVEMPLLPVQISANPVIWRSTLISFCHGATLLSMLTLLPLYLAVVRSATPSEIGLLMVPMTISGGLGAFLTGKLVARTGLAPLISFGGLVLATVALTTFGLWGKDLPLPALSAALVVYGLAMGSVNPVIQIIVQVGADRSMIGSATAAVQVARSLGAAAGPAVTAAVLFLALAGAGPDASAALTAMMAAGMDAVATTPAAETALVAEQVAAAFTLGFLAIAAIAAAGACLTWWIPLRRI